MRVVLALGVGLGLGWMAAHLVGPERTGHQPGVIDASPPSPEDAAPAPGLAVSTKERAVGKGSAMLSAGPQVIDDAPSGAVRSAQRPAGIPAAHRGTPELWLRGLRTALKAGDAERALYYRAALVALGGEAWDALEEVARNIREDGELRAHALLALQACDAGRAGALAMQLFSRTDEPQLVAAALETIAASAPKSLPRAIRELAEDPEAPLQHRVHAVAASLSAESEAARDLLLSWIGSSDARNANTVEEVLRTLRLPALRPVIQARVRASSDADQTYYLHRLAALKGASHDEHQLLGEPDSPLAVDSPAAWASRHAEEGFVTVEAEFEAAVRPEAVRICQSFNPGAIVKIEGRGRSGAWLVLWAGATGSGDKHWFAPELSDPGVSIDTVRLTLDTNLVRGWNELDAVEVIGDGRRQWAVRARSSSCWARR